MKQKGLHETNSTLPSLAGPAMLMMLANGDCLIEALQASFCL